MVGRGFRRLSLSKILGIQDEFDIQFFRARKVMITG
jgi:hypothetical protein